MNKKPLIELKKIKPKWVQAILADQEKMDEAYKNRTWNKLIEIINNPKKKD